MASVPAAITPLSPPAIIPATAAPTAPAAPTEEDLKREEAERERKRRKRQRYRENLKQRALEAEGKSTSAAAPTPDQQVTPPAAPAPVVAEAQPVTPAAANSQLSPAPRSLGEGGTNNSQPPVEYDIPLAETPIVTSTPAAKSDDSVAFVIKAEGVSAETPDANSKKNDGSADVAPKA
jgi:hypothetical protein